MGTIGIRALAGGALSGTEARHPLGMPYVPPIGTAATYGADVEHARLFQPLVDEGYVDSLVEAAFRFVIAEDGVTTALVGVSSIEQLETAAAAVEKGPLPVAALERLGQIWASLAAPSA